MNLPDIGAADLTVSRITRQDLPALTELCVACSAFFEMVEGKPGSPLTAEEILEQLPPGKTARDKHLLGFSRGDSLLAVADLGEDYPVVNDWYVALFIVAPASRQLGLGSRIWMSIESWIRRRGGTRIRLIVQHQNPAGRRFWEVHGFSVTDEAVQRLPDREHRVWRMLKSEGIEPLARTE
jgi:ribosomal protein S18 acetylase RimI-like enzyme